MSSNTMEFPYIIYKIPLRSVWNVMCMWLETTKFMFIYDLSPKRTKLDLSSHPKRINNPVAIHFASRSSPVCMVWSFTTTSCSSIFSGTSLLVGS